MTIDEVPIKNSQGEVKSEPAATTPAVPPTGGQQGAAPPATPVEVAAAAYTVDAARGRPGRTRLIVSVLGALAVVAGLALAVVPYERGLVGYLDGSRTLVASECSAPVVAVFGSSDRTLVDATTWTDEPPCQWSATFRLVLGGLLGVGGAAAIALIASKGRRSGSTTSPG